jgi:hypothetical protein
MKTELIFALPEFDTGQFEDCEFILSSGDARLTVAFYIFLALRKKTAAQKLRRPNGRPDTDRLDRTSVLRNRGAGGIEDRFGERKLQHDLAVVVGHLDDRAQQRAIGAIGLEQLPDHGARHFPGAIGIDKHFAVGIGNQLIADTGVEVISRHRRKPGSG